MNELKIQMQKNKIFFIFQLLSCKIIIVYSVTMSYTFVSTRYAAKSTVSKIR